MSTYSIFVAPSFLLLRLVVLNTSVSIATPILAFKNTFHKGIKVKTLIYLGMSLVAGALHVLA
ncbi:MAG: hypothetical protein ACLKAN_05000 [Alkaliphilus sp.]